MHIRSPQDMLNRLQVAFSFCLIHMEQTHTCANLCISANMRTVRSDYILYVSCLLNKYLFHSLKARSCFLQWWNTHAATHMLQSVHVNSFRLTPGLQSVLSVWEPRGNTISTQPERKLSGDEICCSSLYLWALQAFSRVPVFVCFSPPPSMFSVFSNLQMFCKKKKRKLPLCGCNFT